MYLANTEKKRTEMIGKFIVWDMLLLLSLMLLAPSFIIQMAAIPAIGGILKEFGTTWAIVVAAISVCLIFRNLMSFSLWCPYKLKWSLFYLGVAVVVMTGWFVWGIPLGSTNARALIAKSWWATELNTGLSNFI